MEINQLKYFVKVVELKSFSKASSELFITQPTLSQQISKLENEFKVKLINRTTRSFSVTEAGESFYEEAKRIVEDCEVLAKKLEEYVQNKKGLIRIGLFPTYAKIGKARQISKFSQKYPEYKLEFVENFSEDLYESLLAEKIDFAILNKIAVHDESNIKKLAFFPIVNDRVCVLCSKDNALSKYPSVSFSEAIKHHVFLLPEKTSVTKIVEKELLKKKIALNDFSECESLATLITRVSLDEGVAFLSETTAKHAMKNDTKLLKLIPKIPYVSAVCTLKKNLSNAGVQTFIDFLTKLKR